MWALGLVGLCLDGREGFGHSERRLEGEIGWGGRDGQRGEERGRLEGRRTFFLVMGRR